MTAEATHAPHVASESIVTLLFTDLVGSTEQFEQLGEDSTEQLRRTHFRLLRDAVGAYDGCEVKNLGDGLMAVFPSALDAVGCAVAIQQTVQRHNQHESSGPLQLRIGLHVGEPIREEADYFGKPVVIAKRLCDYADAGQIVISELVHNLVGTRGGYTFRDLGPVALKGLKEPQPACEVVWQAAVQPTVPLPARLASDSIFVGRADELAQLRADLDRAREGQCQLTLVTGEPGIGKTRLTAEFARAAHADGATILLGHSSEETLTPYQPFVEALRQYVATCPLHDLRTQLDRQSGELLRLVPELAERVGDLRAPLEGDPEGQRYRLFEAVTSLLVCASKRAPVVFLLEDLHWADKPTLLLLKHLVRTANSAALLVVGTYRDAEVDAHHPLTDALADLRRDQHPHRISLQGLDELDVGRLVEKLAGHEVVQAFARALNDQTEGNPFFIGEVLRQLSETGKIYQRDGRWTMDRPFDQLGLPEGVREVVTQRLGRLSDPCQRILRIASVIGREFELGLLEHVSDVRGDDLLDLLDEAVMGAAITEVSGAATHYTFAHALIRNTLYYGELTNARRVRLHRGIGEALERIAGANVEPYLAGLAHHFIASVPGGEADKAIDYATRAGERATQLTAYEEAVSCYERALAVLDRQDPRDDGQRCELLLKVGEALSRAGEIRRAKDTFLQAAEIARTLCASEQLARAAVGFHGRSSTTQIGVFDENVVDLLDEALAGLSDSDSPLRARVMARLAGTLAFSEDAKRSESIGRQSIEMARRIGEPSLLADALRHARTALWSTESVEERLALTSELVQLAEQVGETETAMGGHYWRSVSFLEMGNVREADEDLRRYRELAEALRQPIYLHNAHILLTMQALMRGRFREAEGLAHHYLSSGEPMTEQAIQAFGLHTFVIRREQGRVHELEEALKGLVEKYPALPGIRAVLACMYADGDRADDARQEFERLSTNDFADLPRDLAWSMTITYLSEVCCYLGDVNRAAALYELLRPYANRCVVAGAAAFLGSASRTLGLLDVTMGRLEDAVGQLSNALEMNTRVKSPPWIAHTQYDYARTLLARGKPGHREQAIDLLAEAQTTAESLGMSALLREITEVRSGLRATRC